MGRKPKHYPSFFKVLMNDFKLVSSDFASKLDLMSNPIIEPQDSVSEQIKVNPAKARKTRLRKSKEALPHPSSRRTSGIVAEASGSQQQTKHPNFKVVIKKHHRSCLVNQLCDSFSLSLVLLQTLPRNFVRVTGMAEKRGVTLRNEEGKEWRVEICLRTYPTAHGRIDLREGWSDFWKQNKIVYGDSCLFKFIKGAGNVIDVVVQKRGRGW
ncbi:hypothetical protein RHMOL_Rhmol08G0126600 [Rhododendron molle]|uniref:Uncharacterized protein n=1 Tax=Rhododendron molle TaxID=49168 RepID=A0ACC0MP70_RHOML|nr:hypothetical protein RHMOL_Rhmol08G0126600 [Rhododendron molle]